MFNNPQYLGPITEQGVPQAGLAGKVQGMISAPTGPVAYLPAQQPVMPPQMPQYNHQQLQDMRQKYVIPPNLNLDGARRFIMQNQRPPVMPPINPQGFQNPWGRMRQMLPYGMAPMPGGGSRYIQGGDGSLIPLPSFAISDNFRRNIGPVQQGRLANPLEPGTV